MSVADSYKRIRCGGRGIFLLPSLALVISPSCGSGHARADCRHRCPKGGGFQATPHEEKGEGNFLGRRPCKCYDKQCPDQEGCG